ncbi:MAG: His-Xaa-Ser system protein HxsD [Acidobacteria bacterium]|nr:His-Xaa-Ser system protein HxsD [Acidobacteriota bacterium]
MTASQISWIHQLTDAELQICVDSRTYSIESLFRVCYLFTDRCYLFLTRDEALPIVTVRITKKNANTDLATVAGEFANELINQQVRADIAFETKPIRELIVAQAFAEADLLDRVGSRGDYNTDPHGIAK